MDASLPSTDSQQQQQSQPPASSNAAGAVHSASSSTGPQIRSRITVVCAECKRLKLKCDRRTPCGSCTKRDTVARCIYSPAAAEKVDLHSLNNRLIQVESTLQQITAGQTPPVFTSSYPLSQVQASSSTSVATQNSHAHHHHNAAPVPTSHSSLSISLADLTAIWLEGLDLGIPLPSSSHSLSTSSTNDQRYSTPRSRYIKLEPSPVELSLPHHSSNTIVIDSDDVASRPPTSTPPTPSSSITSSPTLDTNVTMTTPSITTTAIQLLLPPLSVYYPVSSLPQHQHQQRQSTYSYPASFPQSLQQQQHHPYSYPSHPTPTLQPQLRNSNTPTVTPALLTFLPSHTTSMRFLDRAGEVMRLRPCFNWPVFRKRAMGVLRNALSSSPTYNSEKERKEKEKKGKAALARAIFFGGGKPQTSGDEECSADEGREESLTFFAATCAALALGALVSRPSTTTSSLSSSPSPPLTAVPTEDPVFLYALSTQALGVYDDEGEDGPDLDYLVASVIGVVFLLISAGKDSAKGKMTAGNEKGKGKGRNQVFVLVGKMVNIARGMGLARDPDEAHPEQGPKGQGYSVFEAETRRRIWWDILWYDLFTSDSMNHPPLIPPNSFTTKMPVCEVDDAQFGPGSPQLPLLESHEDEADEHGEAGGIRYFSVKCRLTQLIRTLKQRTTSAECCCGYTLDHASSLEGEVRKFLADLPIWMHLDLCAPLPTSHAPSKGDTALLAQKCEIATVAHRLILKIYAPFLLRPLGVANQEGWKAPYQASVAAINAARVVVYACRAWHNLGKAHAGWMEDTRSGAVEVGPSMGEFYPVEGALFEGTVVCAHAEIVLKYSAGMGMMWGAGSVMEEVGSALDVLRQLVNSGEKSRGEVGRIVTALHRRVEHAGSVGPSGCGMKRKHDEVEDGTRSLGIAGPDFEFPHLSTGGQGLNTLSPIAQQIQREQQQKKDAVSRVGSTKNGSNASSNGEKDKKHAKKGHAGYPPIGIRVRPNKDGAVSSPLVRQRTGLDAVGDQQGMQAPASPPPLLSGPRGLIDGSDIMVYQQAPQQQSRSQQQTPQQPQNPHPPPLPLIQETNAYRSRSSSITHTEPVHAQQTQHPMNYSMQFNSSEHSNIQDMHAVQRRRLSMQDHQQQQHATSPQRPPFVTSSPTIYDTSQTRLNSLDPPRGPVYDQTRPFDHGHTTAGVEAYSSPYPSSSSAPHTAASSPFATTSGPPHTPTFGPGSGMASHQPSPPTFGPSPVQGYFIPTAFESSGSYEAPIPAHQMHRMDTSLDHRRGAHNTYTQMANSSVPGTPIYEEPQSMYDVKPSNTENQRQQHHPQHQPQVLHQSSSSSYPLETPHDPQSQVHQSSMIMAAPAQNWPPVQQQDSQNEYWSSASGFYQ